MSGVRAGAAGIVVSILILLVSGCGDSSGENGVPAGSPACDDIAGVTEEIEAIRQMAEDAPGGLPEQVGTADSTAALARLADLRDALTADAQQLRDDGDAQAATEVEALAGQIDMVVQRNTLAGAGTGDSGTDPTVNVEEKAAAAAAAAGCADAPS